MSLDKTSEKSVYLDREEHAHKGAVGAKQVVVYYYDSGTDTLKPVNSTNPLPTSGNAKAATSTLTNVTSSATSVTLKASNASRVSLTITNDSTSVLYVKEGATASATSYTWRLASYDTLVIDDYTGIVDGIWVSANGSARVTER